MKFLKRYYNELFSACVFLPLAVFGIGSGIITGIAAIGFSVFLGAIVFRNNKITAFSGLLLAPIVMFRDVISFFGTGPVTAGVFISALFYLFCFSIHHKKDWIWMWYFLVLLWGFEFFNTISFDVVRGGIVFLAFYCIASLYLPLIVDGHNKKPVRFHFFIFLFLALLFELFWVIRILPTGALFGPMIVALFFYFFTHCYRGYLLEKPFRYYVRVGAFTFFSLLAILLTAIGKPFK